MVPHSRRDVGSLAVTSLFGIAGCLSRPGSSAQQSETATSDESYDGFQFTLWNQDDEPHTTSLAVAADGDQLVSETRYVGSDDAVDVFEPIGDGGPYTVSARIETGAAVEQTYDSLCSEDEYLQVQVESPDSVSIEQMRHTVVPAPDC